MKVTAKRWLALGIAISLFLVSVGVDLLTRTLTGELFSAFSLEEDSEFQTTVYDTGKTSGNIALLDVNGEIIETGDASSLFESAGYNHRAFLKTLEHAYEDSAVEGIVLRVNSPGGGVSESAEIYHFLKKYKEKYDKPLFVSMGPMAASGGYYISTPADKIFATPETLTGSIGVIIQQLNYGELTDKLGIEFETFKSGPHKDILSPTREMTEEEEEIIQQLVNNSYEDFVSVIAENRELNEGRVRNIADGRIYDGRQALELGLVDAHGYLDEVIDAMREEVGNYQVIKYQEQSSWTSWLSGVSANVFPEKFENEVVKGLMDSVASPRPYYLYRQ
ncbi:signal peptide peptidase SppA [Bacillaceae bacterium S4-13-56]